jgi:cytochrome b
MKTKEIFNPLFAILIAVIFTIILIFGIGSAHADEETETGEKTQEELEDTCE